jgi:hypothetical protein
VVEVEQVVIVIVYHMVTPTVLAQPILVVAPILAEDIMRLEEILYVLL